MRLLIAIYFFVLSLFAIFSYGFIDLNLHLSSSPVFLTLQKPLEVLVFQMRPIASMIFLALLSMLFFCYIWFLKKGNTFFLTWKRILLLLIAISVLLIVSFPALTYDIFNYITTAKVAFFHHENPYLVMPIDILNEPYLAFTRAANKVALYGPVWILGTAIPHYLGQGNIWLTIIMFKLMNAVCYIGLSYLIYRATKSIKNVMFFALNPLILIETLVSGHNDIYMMLFVVAGILLWEKKDTASKIKGLISFIASCLIKGATLVLLPLFFIKNISRDRLLLIAYWLLAGVFFVVGPLREELYPWYAVWLISIAALLDMKKHAVLIGFTIVLSFALELRHIPYIYMGEYGGVGPIMRTLLTIVPVLLYGGYVAIRKLQSNK
jgi:hypothetical protein